MSRLYRCFRPLIFKLTPERAHGLALAALKLGLVPPGGRPNPMLKTRLWGLDFASPVGLAAGFDKNAEVVRPCLAAGFGFVEVGTLTPRPQDGNPRPRLFRLEEDQAVINRMGFNNEGLEVAEGRLHALRKTKLRGVLGINIGKNKTTEVAATDYSRMTRAMAPLADYLVVNVSSPNTPGLRNLQGKAEVSELLTAVRAALPKDKTPPVLLKIAPDLNDEDLMDIAAVARKGLMDGLIATNTTISRPDSLRSPDRAEAGGLSGAPLFERSTKVLRRLYDLTEGKLPLIGVGGIASAEQAYAKIRAGASLVQIYSAMVYEGPQLAAEITQGLPALLKRDGFYSLQDAVGADHR